MKMTLPSLSRAFKNDIGMSLKGYINQQINKDICDLLITTDMYANQIADKYKFTDACYFNRFFRKLNGVTPNQYRQIIEKYG